MFGEQKRSKIIVVVRKYINKLFGKKNPIEELSIEDLEDEKTRLKSKLDRLEEEINQMANKKKQLFQEGIGADISKKKILAQEIKALESEMKSKSKNLTILKKQYNFVDFLLAIKKYEKELKRIGLWDKISKVNPEDLPAVAPYAFEMRSDDSYEEVDSTEKKLLDAWAQVESGAVDVDMVVDNLNLDVDEEEDDELFKRLEKES